MSIGLNVYNKRYRNTLSLHKCVKLYKETLDDIDKDILIGVEDFDFCKRDHEWNILIPDMEWKGEDFE